MPGRCLTGAEVMREIEKDILFFDESEGGVTFSGGEPLMQPEFLNALLRLCAAQDIHTVVDTCGYAPPEIFQAVLEHVDLVLYDLKIIDDAAHQQYTGVSNRPVLDNLHVLSESDVPYYVRVPVIPGITDTRANIDAMLMLLDKRHGIQQVNLLPYHRTAVHKYARLRQEYRMSPIDPPSEAHLQALKKTFEAHGFDTTIGG